MATVDNEQWKTRERTNFTIGGQGESTSGANPMERRKQKDELTWTYFPMVGEDG